MCFIYLVKIILKGNVNLISKLVLRKFIVEIDE